MANLMDIYHRVGKNLYEHNFDQASIEDKKQLVDGSLKTYLATKIIEEDISKAFLLSNDKDVSVEDLVTILGEIIPQEAHFDTMRHLTHFLLNIAGEMQGWSITWYEDQDHQFIENPLLTQDESGKWDSLTTHKETSYVQTFCFVYDSYKKSFMEKTPTDKQLSIGQKQIKDNE